jgi:DNA-binding GntR family transcriptional regulator
VEESLAGQLYEVIKNEIITCALQPGQQIAQPQLAEKYQRGTTPVREALQRLAQEGLVQPIPRFGYIVTPISVADVTAMYELRSILEAAAARLAATRGPQEQLDRIVELADCRYAFTDRESYSRFLTHNSEFHRSVAVASGNPKLVEFLSRLLDEMNRVFHLRPDPSDNSEEMRTEHKALAEALCERNPDEAERIAAEQIARSQQRVLATLISMAGVGASALGQMVQLGSSPANWSWPEKLSDINRRDD